MIKIVGFAMSFVIAGTGLVSMFLQGGVDEDIRPPAAIPRAIVVGCLLLVPGIVGTIGAVRASRITLMAAGAITLGLSFGVFWLAIPAFVLLAITGLSRTREPPTSHQLAVGIVIVLFGLGSWLALAAMRQPRCWAATPGSDGELVYVDTPTMDLAPGQVAAGCDGGEPTLLGYVTGASLAAGAVALALAPNATRT